MKSLTIFTTTFLLTALCGFVCKEDTIKTPSPLAGGFTLIELFTSEGCSSCPPADALMAAIKNEQHQNVFILAYHVDYWNRLGWKDVFSKAEWSQRQQWYAQQMDKEGVYTPQAIINGSSEFVASNEGRLRAAIKENAGKKAASLTVSATKSATGVQLRYETDAPIPAMLNIALVQPEATTNVKRGENEGRKLHHVNVVRELTTTEITKATGETSINIPEALRNTPLTVIAFIQQKSGTAINAAGEAAVN